MPNPDDILRNKLREGDIDTFKSLFESYYDQLVRYGISITHDQEVSKGLVQNVFLQIWENRQKNILKGSVKAYLFTSTNHQALNWLRHEKIKQAYKSNKLKDVLSGVELPDMEGPFLTEAIKRSIDELPEKARIIFTMSQLEGIPQKEIAQDLGLSIKTIENQIGRSRKILQKKLRRYR